MKVRLNWRTNIKAIGIILAGALAFFISFSIKTKFDSNQLGGKPPYYEGRDNFVEPNPHVGK